MAPGVLTIEEMLLKHATAVLCMSGATKENKTKVIL
jgi:hypothetical protein